MQSQFDVSAISWDAKTGWKQEFFPMPTTSGIIKAWGSGQGAVDKWYQRWLSTRQGSRTSRSVFSAFCDALAAGEDSFTGGAPQLVGLYRQGMGETFGVIFAGSRYVLGIPSQDLPLANPIEWRNALFERCDGQTMQRLDEAQRHSRPQGLGRSL